ncbi:hypothetical protein ACWELV_19090 [Streptomyces mirabilis]|uniref:hypothetical protein n=1 Tax=unclassified Streptomyces TaxID=2593676 RepID=UPI001C30E340|nr:hypothetical protein [Streptomyces sp. GbtcB7]
MNEFTAAVAPLTAFTGAIIGAVIIVAIAHPDATMRVRAFRVLEILFARQDEK